MINNGEKEKADIFVDCFHPVPRELVRGCYTRNFGSFVCVTEISFGAASLASDARKASSSLKIFNILRWPTSTYILVFAIAYVAASHLYLL